MTAPQKPARIRVIDKGYSKLLATVAGKIPTVRVGVFGERAARVHGVRKSTEADSEPEKLLTLGQLADWLENGNENMPGWRWLSGYVETNQARILDLLRNASEGILQGKVKKEQAMKLIGLQIVGDIKQRIANGLEPPNAESTIRRKGSSKPLIDTGQFRNSIASEVKS